MGEMITALFFALSIAAVDGGSRLIKYNTGAAVVAHRLRGGNRLIAIIWHVDPESEGTDNSCGWFQEYRFWWQHPRWHVHHWRFQVHFIQNMKRWLFSRCSYCGKRFSWGYSPISSAWDGGGPQWFRGENSLSHHGCGIPKRETADLGVEHNASPATPRHSIHGVVKPAVKGVASG